MVKRTRLSPSAPRCGWRKISTSKRTLASAITTRKPTAQSTVGFTPGQLRSADRRAAAAMAIHALCRQETSRVYARAVGTCRARPNGKLCSMQSVNDQLLARFSSPRPVGIIVATARKRSPSRHCLLATGTTLGITTARATARTSGVLQRAVASARTTCTCTTTTTMRAWAATSSTTGFQFVV